MIVLRICYCTRINYEGKDQANIKMTQQTNSFERLVTTACEEGWCWRLYCTTCGNMGFRNGLELIGMGELAPRIERNALEQTILFGDKPASFERDIPLACELTRANLTDLSKLSIPDWLGCLGLALYRFETPPMLQITDDEEKAYYNSRFECWRMISSSWASQFLELLGKKDKQLYELLKQCEKGMSCLRWQEMTPIEEALEAIVNKNMT